MSNKPQYKCQECGIETDKVKPYKKGECPESMTGHRFEKKPRKVLNFRKTLNLSGDEVSWLWWRLTELEKSDKPCPEIATRILKKLEVRGHYERKK